MGPSGQQVGRLALNRSHFSASGRWVLAIAIAVVSIGLLESGRAALGMSKNPHMGVTVAGGLAALMFLSLGCFLLYAALVNRGAAAVPMRWPTVSGTIISGQVESRIPETAWPLTEYLPRVCYAYECNGRPWRATAICIAPYSVGYFCEKDACEHLARYPAGGTVSVLYDPDNPGRAVLELGRPREGFVVMTSISFLVLGLALLGASIWSMGAVAS